MAARVGTEPGAKLSDCVQGWFEVPDDSRRQLDDARAATLRRIEHLTRSFDEIVVAATDVATDDEHDPEGHTIAWERQQVAALLSKANADRASIEAAIARLDEGDYGRCLHCGEAISSARLEALPDVTDCISCAD